jgi:hypothetical protein
MCGVISDSCELQPLRVLDSQAITWALRGLRNFERRLNLCFRRCVLRAAPTRKTGQDCWGRMLASLASSGRGNLPSRCLRRPRVVVPRWVMKEASLTREHVNDIADLGEFISRKVILALPRRKNRSSALSLAALQHAQPANAPS